MHLMNNLLSLLFLGHQTFSFLPQPDIRLDIYANANSKSSLCFFSPHENEHVVNASLARTIEHKGGRYLILRQAGERHIKLRFGNDLVEVDPNRIFTAAGVLASLLKENKSLELNQGLLYMAHARAVSLGRFVLAHLGHYTAQTVIVAVHNNTEGYTGDGRHGIGTISIKRYQKKLAGGARFLEAVFEGKGDEDDLYFITDRRDYDQLRKGNWNVVLQNPEVARLVDENDGSLSVWAEMAGIRYLNIEAQRKDDLGEGKDHLREQERMVAYLYTHLPR